MALGQPGQDDVENTPQSIIQPGMSFDPIKALGMFKDAIMSHMGQPTIPEQPQVGGQNQQEPHPIEVAQNHTISPGSHPLINAIDSGYADKKIMKPMEDIREGLKSGDHDLVKKGHKTLSELLLGERTFGQWYRDTFVHGGATDQAARSMAGDIVMREIARMGKPGMPTAEEAVRLGMIRPSELIPGEQVDEDYAHLIPHESMGFNDDGSPISSVQMRPEPAQPGQEPQRTIIPDTRLTPYQYETTHARQKAISSGMDIKRDLADAKMELQQEQINMLRAKRETELPAKVDAMKSMNTLRTAQVELAHARVDWLKKLPDLRRELHGGDSPLEIESLKRVHKAITDKTPINKADWLVAQRWLTKGNPQFGMDFMGRAYNRFTGESEKKGGALGWLGIQEPPSTLDEEQTKEAESIDTDMMHQLGQFIGSLIHGAPDKKEAELPTPKTPAEALKLKPGTRYRRPDGKEMVR